MIMTRTMPLAISLVVFIAVGCGSSTSTDTTGDTSRSTTTTDGTRSTTDEEELAEWGDLDVVVVRRLGGGLVPVGSDEAALPDVIVYGDGTVISTDPTTGDPSTLQLDDTELARLVADVRGSGFADLPTAVHSEAEAAIADAPTTTIGVMNRDGSLHEVSAYALGYDDYGYPNALIEADQALTRLQERVANEGGAWVSDRLTLVVVGFPSAQQVEDDFTVAPVTWPEGVGIPEILDDPALVDIPVPVTFEGEDAEAMAAIIDAEAYVTLIRLPRGTIIQALDRPVLPHE
jgi:hypothetical protein